MYYNARAIATICRGVLQEKGLTQSEAAQKLGVSQSAVAQALNSDEVTMRHSKVRSRILKEIGGLWIEDEPVWEVRNEAPSQETVIDHLPDAPDVEFGDDGTVL